MRKFQPYSRRHLRRLRAAWIRRNAVFLGLGVGVIAAVVTCTSVMLLTLAHGAVTWYVLGLIHAGLVAGILHALDSAFLAHDREALWHVRGAWGEENTRSELQRARRRRLIWGWVDSINLQAGDLDHVVVSRRGGLVAVDSKWRTTVSAQDTADMARAANRARARTEGLVRTLLRNERGARHRAKTQPLTVTPLVVLWGAAQHTVPEHAMIDGVRFVSGRKLVTWLRDFEGDVVPKDAAKDALVRLERYRETAWQDA